MNCARFRRDECPGDATCHRYHSCRIMHEAPKLVLSTGKVVALPDYYTELGDGRIVRQSYLEATDAVRAAVCNGCGSRGKIDIVPDQLYGMPIKDACWPHDWDYAEGETAEEKVWADEIFRHNLRTLCLARSDNAILTRLRLLAADGYFEAVQHFGNEAYWRGKG